jgi:hypothetical protein
MQFNQVLLQRLRTGDVVFFTEHDSRLVKAFKWLSKGDQYHVGIVVQLKFNEEHIPFLVEAMPYGRRLTNMNVYKDASMQVLRFNGYRMDSRYICMHHFGHLLDGVGKTDYSFIGWLCMVLYEKLGIRIKKYKGETCAEMIAEMFEFKDTQIFPTTLYNQLLKRNFLIFMRIN